MTTFAVMKKIIFLGVFSAAMVALIYFSMKPKEEALPVINPIDLEDEMVDPELLRVGYGHTIGDFKFTDHEGRMISSKQVEGKVYVVEYFFTTCKSICPVMNKQMQRVHQAYKHDPTFRILSFTVDPVNDSQEVMKAYAADHNVEEGSNWHFITGKKEKLYALARKSFFVLKPAEAENLGDAGSDFIHTNNFVLIDGEGRIRGYYDGTSEKEVDKLIGDIALLKAE